MAESPSMILFILSFNKRHLGAAFFGGLVRDGGSNPRWPAPPLES